MTVFARVSRVSEYPDKDLYGERFENLVRRWRPELVALQNERVAG